MLSSDTLNGIAATTDGQVWAVGYATLAGSQFPLVVHFNGSSWSRTVLAKPTGATAAFFTSVDLYDADSLWAVGYYLDADFNVHTLTEYSSGTQWTQVSSPDGGTHYNRLDRVWFTTEGQVWAAGTASDSNGTAGLRTLLLHWNDTTWQVISTPDLGSTDRRLLGIATATGTFPVITSVWAVGSYRTSSLTAYHTLVEKIVAPTPPPTTTSYYEHSVDYAVQYPQGCAAADRGEAGNIVLDYGKPVNLATRTPNATPIYGALLVQKKNAQQTPVGTPVYASISDISTAVAGYIDGYHDAYTPNPESSTGCPTAVAIPKNITLALGINNSEPTTTPSVVSRAELSSGHAQAWAVLVADSIAYAAARGFRNIDVAAGVDFEPDFSSAADNYMRSKQWGDNYLNAGVSSYYNFGSTDGYPGPVPVVTPGWGCCSGWTAEQQYGVSFTSLAPNADSGYLVGARALPEIYHQSVARDWYRVRRWGIDAQLGPQGFFGAMTECQSSNCLTNPNELNAIKAWRVFWLLLNSDPATAQSSLGGITDIAHGAVPPTPTP